MKFISFVISTLLCLVLQVSAQSPETTIHTLTGEAATKLDRNTSEPTEPAPYIEDSLGLPVMRDQLTITESSQGLSLAGEDIDENYGKMMQAFAATLDGTGTTLTENRQPRELNKMLSILIGFLVETISTSIVLKIAFQLGEHRARLRLILPISLAVASVGALVHYTVGLHLFHPIQIGLSLFLLLMILRLATDVHEWAAALQITFAARLASLGVLWLSYTSMTLLVGL